MTRKAKPTAGLPTVMALVYRTERGYKAQVTLSGAAADAEVQFCPGTIWRPAPGGLAEIIMPDPLASLSRSARYGSRALVVTARVEAAGEYIYSDPVEVG